MRKKILAAAMVAVMAVQLAGCGKGQGEAAENSVEASETADTEMQDEERAAAPADTEMQDEEGAAAPADTEIQDEEKAAATEEATEEEISEEMLEEIGVQFVSWEDAGLEDHVMDWKDEFLAWQMRRITGKEEVMLSEVWEMSSLTINGEIYVNDISALSELRNLRELSLFGTAVRDTSALSGLTNLWRVYLPE